MSKLLNPEEMTSRDYYFDSYAHFGIHEVNHAELSPAVPSLLENSVMCSTVCCHKVGFPSGPMSLALPPESLSGRGSGPGLQQVSSWKHMFVCFSAREQGLEGRGGQSLGFFSFMVQHLCLLNPKPR